MSSTNGTIKKLSSILTNIVRTCVRACVLIIAAHVSLAGQQCWNVHPHLSKSSDGHKAAINRILIEAH
eukprot:4324514-Amphidinium_carterae.1